MRYCGAFTGLILFCCCISEAGVLRVDSRVELTQPDGATWATAYARLDDAVTAASIGDEIWIAAGRYTPAPIAVAGTQMATFALSKTLSIYGGFAGSEDSRELRNPLQNPVILSGDMANNDTGDGISHTDNCYHVVSILSGASVTLDGLTITGGTASGSSAAASGGGIRIVASTLTLANCNVEDNYATVSGGGIYSDRGSLTLQDSRVRNNRASGGAGLFLNQGMAALSRSFLMYNAADSAGGLQAVSNAAINMENCVVASNSASGTGGGLTLNSNAEATIEFSTFVNNTSGTSGGAIYVGEGRLTVANSVFWSNPPESIFNDDPATHACVVSRSIIEGGFDGGVEIVETDPRFRTGSTDYPYQPSYDSPALDVADGESPATDIRGVERPQGAASDLGAYEFEADTDGGGLPDAYEAQYGLNPEDAADDSADLDGDGLGNLEEFRRNTDPSDPNDPPSHFYVAETGNDDTGTGSEETPWQTIGHAMEQLPEGSSNFPVTLHVGPGLFLEKVVLRPYTRLIGAGPSATTIQYFDMSDNDPVVVTGADGGRLEACAVTVPQATTAIIELLRLRDVAMRVNNVIFDGKDGIHVTGIFVTGPDSSASVIRNCVVQRLEYGIVAVNSAVNITRNLFDSMFEGAIFIRQPEGKGDVELQMPVMGSEDDMPATGFNRFRETQGFLVRNLTAGEAPAQYNDWGVYSEAELADQFGAKAGAVKYQPYVGQSIVPGSVLVGVQDQATNKAIPVAKSPSVKMGTTLGAMDSASSLFMFTALPAGTYTCQASAMGFVGQTMSITAIAGDITATTLKLSASAIVEGEFSVEGDGPGPNEGETVAEGEPEGGAPIEGESQGGVVEGDQPLPTRRGCF